MIGLRRSSGALEISVAMRVARTPERPHAFVNVEGWMNVHGETEITGAIMPSFL